MWSGLEGYLKVLRHVTQLLSPHLQSIKSSLASWVAADLSMDKLSFDTQTIQNDNYRHAPASARAVRGMPPSARWTLVHPASHSRAQHVQQPAALWTSSKRRHRRLWPGAVRSEPPCLALPCRHPRCRRHHGPAILIMDYVLNGNRVYEEVVCGSSDDDR